MSIVDVIGFFWIFFMVYWFISGIRSKKSVRIKNKKWLQSPGFRIIFFAFVFFVFQISGAWSFFRDRDFFSNPIYKVIGIVLLTCGWALAVWARVYLGKNWGMPMTLRKEHDLVIAGPYKWVRHPIYSGFLLAMLGSALVGGFIWIIIFMASGIYFTYSAKVEEKMMIEQFPNQYTKYERKTKMLVPFVF
jgi:protein-S-isoprenylcysteine O-methyltransferase Ste14